jgi:hypothetical protein
LDKDIVTLTEQLDKEMEKLSGEEITPDDLARENICTLPEELEQSLSQVSYLLRSVF